MAQEFRQQLTYGAPSATDEEGLQRLRSQLLAHKLQVKLFLGLLPFQEAAVQIAVHHVSKRNGVIIGDVVGLGKTLVGTAIAHLCEEDYGTSTLIICPKNLEKMWQDYIDRYGLRGKVVPISRAIQELPNVPAWFRLVLIDESHNLRNKEGKRYQAIKDYSRAAVDVFC
jgi:superfamily II DNA or RNA helicase